MLARAAFEERTQRAGIHASRARDAAVVQKGRGEIHDADQRVGFRIRLDAGAGSDQWHTDGSLIRYVLAPAVVLAEHLAVVA